MVAIIKYNAGNTQSVFNAVQRLGYEAIITDDEALIKNAEKVIFPGVGEASSAMKYLKEKGLDTLIKKLQQPTLGICLGQQLMCQYSEEGNTECLGIFPIRVKRFPPTDIVPHMGWNTITITRNNILLKNIEDFSDVYYVHNFYCEPSEYNIAETQYILPFSAALQKDNFYATQFHPEKSADIGEEILKNFLSL
ncbi:imidazole glycerol phosphate synthase subunit HisH [Elizabethkingia sp. JS20170427COW]|uniref:imidazole glycerol phosphate synthase subunit HisH n=1 Tax=Elizabethkingia sp. JS20170427COW TaxID=2583851 RepID=UPI0011100432|nr:imidazole glycerol phosphate synthase subunit HisH [Elizabethkingia sp. JS20170427COW]QCX54174.1 imidazole glycerol phosphate synthase subunit HisH [Elizabethkingia sp. JS20170427COW]